MQQEYQRIYPVWWAFKYSVTPGLQLKKVENHLTLFDLSSCLLYKKNLPVPVTVTVLLMCPGWPPDVSVC